MIRENSPVEYDVRDDIAFIRLNRPHAGNAMDQAVAHALADIAVRCADHATLRGVLITGNGRVFSVGGDITAFEAATPQRLPEVLASMAAPYHEALNTFSELDVPVVTAVHGACAGGALGLVYVADVALAAADTKFVAGFGAIGLSGDGGNSWFLPRLVGVRRAAEMYLENRVVSASEAAEWGLVSRVVATAALPGEADALVRRLAAGPTRCFGAIRRLMRGSWSNTLAEQLSAETEELRRSAATSDASAAIEAFVSKHRPVFAGK